MHLATLVHDDSVDHSVLRRGLPTVNSLFSHQVSVIMGDFLYSRALMALVRMGDLEIMRIVTDVANEMTIGEMRQLAAVDAPGVHRRGLLPPDSREDGVADLGRLRERRAVRRAGVSRSHSPSSATGSAWRSRSPTTFSTTPGNESVTGKPGGLDLREHKVTLPLIAALPHVSTAARARIDSLFAAENPEDEAIAEVIGIVSEAGGIEYARRRGEQFAHDAEQALRVLPESPVRSALTDAIAYVMDRRS